MSDYYIANARPIRRYVTAEHAASIAEDLVGPREVNPVVYDMAFAEASEFLALVEPGDLLHIVGADYPSQDEWIPITPEQAEAHNRAAVLSNARKFGLLKVRVNHILGVDPASRSNAEKRIDRALSAYVDRASLFLFVLLILIVAAILYLKGI